MSYKKVTPLAQKTKKNTKTTQKEAMSRTKSVFSSFDGMSRAKSMKTKSIQPKTYKNDKCLVQNQGSGENYQFLHANQQV